MAQILSAHYPSIDDLMASDIAELTEIDGIGPVIARDIVAYFERSGNRELIARLRQRGVQMHAEEPSPSEEPAKQPLQGLSLVITGTLPGLSRQQATELITAAGGRVVGSVSSKTDYLVMGDAPGASKVQQAAKYGVPTLDENGLRALLSGQAGELEG